MGSWSTTAPTLPSGASWSAYTACGKTGSGNDNYYFRNQARIARGPGDTIYIQCNLQVSLKSGGDSTKWIYVGAAVTVGGGAEEDSGGKKCGNWPGTDWSTRATVYYTGTAAPGTTIRFWAYQSSYVTPKGTLTAPDLITYSVTYDGNGAEGGSTEGQTKIHGVDLTLRQSGFIRNGWAFDWWNTAADGTGTTYQADEVYTDNAALVLYAIWHQTDIPVYVNDNGVIRRIAKAYANVNGVIRECDIYVNVNGVIKLLI